ncbi:toxin-antitoxin system YwqK family antitoxin [Rufibacter sp. DG15C]|uniref:toxin-antitoxin system YwqK family antitoxin n=1 Tax=Rufibacter sp. DG15C TaxID=1379909 RepID=UPI0012F8A89D|nr:hypothetical protein [Rufibacter sp. DG15C]
MQAQVWPWKWNQVDKDGNRHGRWRVFYEHKQAQVLSQGKYKHGKDFGTWKTFSETGKLERLEKYERNGKRIQTTFYHPNGKVSHKGAAYLFEQDSLLMYKWHGDWQYYDSLGTWVGWKSFHRGRPTSEKPIPTKANTSNKK